MSKPERQKVNTGSKFEKLVGFSRAVKAGNIIEVAGTAAIDENTMIVGKGDEYAQTKFIIEKIERALKELGSSLEDVIRTRIFVTDISRWEAIAKAHNEFFHDIRPVTAMIEVKGFIDSDMLVEIEATAIIDHLSLSIDQW